MMMLFKLALSLAFASLLSAELGSKTLDVGTGVAKGPVTLAGRGLRVKKVAFIKVKVYDAFLYVTDPGAVHREKGAALDSIASQSRWLVGLKFLRTVDEGRIVQSFVDSLKANHLDPESAGLKELLAAVKAAGETKEGQSLLIAGVHGASGDELIFANGRGETTAIKANGELFKHVLAIWFGTHDESTLDDLEKDLLKTPGGE